MKLIEKYGENGEPIYTKVFWTDHYEGCEQCRAVDLNQSSSFVNACVLGSQLLNEELIKRQIRVVQKKRDEVRKWAEKAGVFKM